MERAASPAPATDDDSRLLRLAITGRVTAEAIAGFRATLEAALGTGSDFVVVFDRRAMTAPTSEGREALNRMAEELMPRLAGPCLGWADVFDERRAASLTRAARAAREGADGGAGEVEGPYPHKVFSDPERAAEWAVERVL